MPLNNILRNGNLYVDGRSQIGDFSEFVPPNLEALVEDYKPGGLNGTTDVVLGQQKMTASFALTNFDPDVLALYGVVDEATVPLIFRGHLQSNNGVNVGMSATCRGKIRTVELGQYTPGQMTMNRYTMTVEYFKYVQGGRVVYEVDFASNIFRVDGVDKLLQERINLGIA
jgi:P2 family phage contractile tail tube protein